MPSTTMKEEVLPVAYDEGDALHVSERAARVFVSRPRTMVIVFWGTVLLVTMIVMAAGWFDIADPSTDDFQVSSSLDSEHTDSLRDARNQVDVTGGVAVTARSEFSSPSATKMIFEWTDESRSDEILIPANLKLICEFQRIVSGAPGYPKFCKPVGGVVNGLNTDCDEQAFDLVAKFYPTVAEQAECAELNSTFFSAQLAALESDPFTLAFFQPRDAALPTSVRTYTRSTLGLYGPLGADSTGGATFDELLDDEVDISSVQGEVYAEFLRPLEIEVFDTYGIELDTFFGTGYNVGAIPLGNGMQVRFQNLFWLQEEFDRILNGDLSLAVGSIAFVSIFMRIHTRSTWLTVNGMLSVVFSLFVGMSIYSGLGRIIYFTQIQAIVIFLILGIGADNIFVYFDTYEQSRSRWQSVRGIMTEAEAGEKNVYGTGDGAREVLVARVAYTYKRATGTIFMTNLTTSLAFLSTGVSEVVPIAAFGYYAASCIVANFLFSVLGYPAFAVVYELYFRDKAACCCCSGAHSDDDDMTKGVGASSTSTGSASLEDGKSGAPSNGPAGHRQFVRVAEEEQALTWEEKIIHRGYVPFEFSKVSIGGRTVRLVPILCTGVLMVFIFVMASLALQLETPTELTQNFSDDHMDSSFLNDFFNIFKGGSDFMTTEVTFGIKGIDRGCLSKFEPDGCRGSAIFDDAFDLAPQANQQYVLDLCADYAALSCVPVGATEPLVGCVDDLGAAVRSVDCTLQDFHDWHNATHPTDPLPALELGTSNSTLWNLRLSEFADEQGLQRFVGFIDGTLKLFVFTYEATLITNGPVPTKEPVLDLLDAFLDAEAADAPAGLDTVFQAGLDFNFINTELAIVDGMYLGLTISVPLAFLVLLFATRNIILSIFAITSIIGIIASVLGTAQIMGWSLGIAEAIAAIMVVGLSVDYSIIHGTVYTQAADDGVFSRVERTRFSALTAGHTVVAGAITTVGAAFVLYATTFVFFSRMATLISLTIIYSLLMTELLFMSLCLLMGPQGNCGNVAFWRSAPSRPSSIDK